MLNYLFHIRDEIDFILSISQNRNKEQIEGDETVKRAIVRSLEIIGEATKHIDKEFRAKYPNVDWRAMAGTRDKLIHNYMDIDYDIVYDIIINELPDLQVAINKIIEIEC